MIDYVANFHEKFDLPDGSVDVLATDEEAQEYRIRFLAEELTELTEALADGDRVKAFDALLDLAYVVYGTALFAGISPDQWRSGMIAVHNCNMAKERAPTAEASKRGSAFDVVKPPGWIGPEARLKEILAWPK